MKPGAKFSRQPLFFAAMAYAAGVLGGARWWRPPLWWLCGVVVFAGAALYWRRTRPRCAAAMSLLALAAAGAFALQAQHAGSSPPDISRFSGGEVIVTGHVLREGLVRQGAFGDQRQSLDVETDQIAADEDVSAVRVGVRLTIYSRELAQDTDTASDTPATGSGGGGDPGLQPGLGGSQRRRNPDGDTLTRQFAARALRYGERVRFPAKLRLPRNYGNPGSLDYRGYLARQGILATASVRADRVEVLAGFGGSWWGLCSSRARHSVLARIHALWPEQGPGLMDAMLIGERAYIGRDTSLSFQRTGAYHILVVSGMNVGILAFVVFWVLRRVRVTEVVAALVTLGGAAGYAYLCELGAPIVRSVLMLAVYLGARMLYRDRALLNAVGAAALVLLAVDARALFDTSFQLTFIAVVAIAAIGVPLLERTSAPYQRALRNLDATGYDLALAPRLVQFRLDLRMVGERLGRLFGATLSRWVLARSAGALLSTWEVLIISGLMQVAMALPMAAYFHRATMLALPANTLVVPATGALMPAATAAVALAYVWMPLAKVPALIAGAALDVITGTVRVLGHLRVAEVRVATPTVVVAVIAVVAFGFAMWATRRRALVAATGLVALVGAAAWITVVPPRPQLKPAVLELTAIDVGQADSTLIVTPQGRTLLVDAAGSIGAWRSEFDFGEDVVSPYLWARGITRLDAVALTHAHEDHIGGMRAVVANFHPRELWLGPNAETAALKALLAEAERQGTRVLRRTGGDSFEFGGAQVRVLLPPTDWELAAKPRNNDSMVMEISYQRTAALLEGDAERKMERDFIAAQPRADLLKVAHNGSATSTSPELLDVVRPKFAVISVGAQNSFGHPRREVLARLEAAKVATYRTDTMGAMTFYLDGNSVTPKRVALLPQ